MATDDESQIAEDFGTMVRMITGSAMQVRENQLRRSTVQFQQQGTEQAEQDRVRANAARVVQHDLYSREFWRTAGSESIADRLAVAAALGDRDPSALSAWMHGADVLRSEFGIDLQEINRKHPSSLEDRHAAMRDALDDHFAQVGRDQADDRAAQARQVLAQEQDQTQQLDRDPGRKPEPREEQGQSTQSEEPELFFIRDLSNDRGDIRAVEKEGALNAIENAPENLGQDSPGAWEDVKGWIGKDKDVDRAIAEKFPDAMTDEQRARALGQVEEPETYVDTSGVDARTDERREHQEAEADAQRVEHVDDAAVAVRRDVARLTDTAGPQLAEVRSVQLSSFPTEPHVLNPAKLKQQTRKPAAAHTPSQERGEVLSR